MWEICRPSLRCSVGLCLAHNASCAENQARRSLLSVNLRGLVLSAKSSAVCLYSCSRRGYFFLPPFFLAAQYCFSLSETAFLAAADIGLRFFVATFFFAGASARASIARFTRASRRSRCACSLRRETRTLLNGLISQSPDSRHGVRSVGPIIVRKLRCGKGLSCFCPPGHRGKLLQHRTNLSGLSL